jgi:hypothetical protein
VPDDEHLSESEGEETGDLGRDARRVELAVGAEEEKLLEGVGALARAVERGVGEAEHLPRAGLLRRAQPPLQRAPRLDDRLAVGEVAVRRLRLTQGGGTLRGERRGGEERERQRGERGADHG